MNTTRRDVIKAAISAIAIRAALRSEVQSRGVLEPFNYSGVRLLDGMLRRQCLFARDFFNSIPDDNLLIGFRSRAGKPASGTSLGGWYGGDVFNAFGQYLSGMARLSKALGDAEIGAKANLLMLEWAKTIEPEGYFYYSRKPITPHYIYDKMMCGLVDLYEYGGSKDAAPLMEKITDWAAANLDRSRKRALEGGATYDGNGEWYTLPENLYRAYQLTGNTKYKNFADVWRYPAYWGMFTRSEEPDPFGFHAYSHVNTLSSAAMAFTISGDPQYFRAIKNAFDWLERTQMYATGGFGPNEKLLPPDGSLGASLETAQFSFETVCGSWAGFKLGRYLICLTGHARYGDWIEKLVYNGIGAALPLKPDGSNFYYSDYTLGGASKGYHSAKWACCSGTYPQVIADYHNVIYFRDSDGLYVNLYVPSEVTWNHHGNEVVVSQETTYPETETSVITVRPGKPRTFSLKFRVPRWSRGLLAQINGNPVDLETSPGGWAMLRRMWNDGDRVTIRIPMQITYAPIDQQHPNRVALTYGPAVLVRHDSPTLTPGTGPPSNWIVREGGELQFRADNQRPGMFMPFYKLGFGENYQMYFDLRS